MSPAPAPAPAPAPKLTHHTALIFDVYGTLVDWETGIHAALAASTPPLPLPATWARADVLRAFGAVEADLQAQHPAMPYSALLAAAHLALRRRLEALLDPDQDTDLDVGTVDGDGQSAAREDRAAAEQAAAASFAASIAAWPVFPDTPRALRTLAEHFTLLALSNVDRASFAHTLPALRGDPAPAPSPAALDAPSASTSPSPSTSASTSTSAPASAPALAPGPPIPDPPTPFTSLLTAQDLGAYKPSPTTFSRALAHLQHAHGAPPARVLAVAQSLFHDHAPARAAGLARGVWIDRAGAVMGLGADGGAGEREGFGGREGRGAEEGEEGEEGKGGLCGWRFESLGALAEAVRREIEEAQRVTATAT